MLLLLQVRYARDVFATTAIFIVLQARAVGSEEGRKALIRGDDELAESLASSRQWEPHYGLEYHVLPFSRAQLSQWGVGAAPSETIHRHHPNSFTDELRTTAAKNGWTLDGASLSQLPADAALFLHTPNIFIPTDFRLKTGAITSSPAAHTPDGVASSDPCTDGLLPAGIAGTPEPPTPSLKQPSPPPLIAADTQMDAIVTPALDEAEANTLGTASTGRMYIQHPHPLDAPLAADLSTAAIAGVAPPPVLRFEAIRPVPQLLDMSSGSALASNVDLWFRNDTQFGLPKAYFYAQSRLPGLASVGRDPRSRLLASLWVGVSV
jgi:hypothetical protein